MPKVSTSYKKGQSGNLKGAPKKEWTFASIYKEEMEEVLTATDGTKMEVKKAVAKRLAKMAVEGDIQAIRELGNRIEGMPKQSTELEGVINIIIDKALEKNE